MKKKWPLREGVTLGGLRYVGDILIFGSNKIHFFIIIIFLTLKMFMHINRIISNVSPFSFLSKKIPFYNDLL